MTLGHVSAGPGHVAAHNAERDVINTLSDLVESGRLSEDGLNSLINDIVSEAMSNVSSGLPQANKVAGRILALDTQAEPAWADPVDPTIYNIDVKPWEEAPLLYSYSFENGLNQPGWDHANEFNPLTALAADVPAGHPSYAYFMKQDYPYGQSWMRLQMAQIAALNGKTLTRLKCWVKVESSNGGAANFAIQQASGGIIRYQVLLPGTQTTEWVHVDVPWTAAVDAFFTTQANTRAYTTGVEIYGTSVPYNINDVVRYNGVFWKSLQDNNPYEPGVQGWVEF